MLFPKLDYDGSLQPQHRQRIRHIREQLGLTYKDFALMLGCDWSTILKWENGDSTRSQNAMTDILRQIFQGDLDIRFSERQTRLKQLMQERIQDIILERRQHTDSHCNR